MSVPDPAPSAPAPDASAPLPLPSGAGAPPLANPASSITARLLSLRALLAALVVILWFGSLGIRSLVPSDEGRYAEIAREMVVSGDWITPRYNAVKYFEKPPLHMWLSAATFRAFGVGEWQARLGGALVSLLGTLAMAWAARRWYGPRVGWLTAALLVSTPLWNGGAHFNSLDATVAGFLACALAAFLLAFAPAATAAPAAGPPPGGRSAEDAASLAAAIRRRRWLLACWSAMALATLTKGLIGLVLPALALLSYCLVTRQWRWLRGLEWLRGPAIYLSITAPWFIAVSLRNPEFNQFFFIHEHLQRYLSTIHRRQGAPWYFVPILVLGCLPWSGLTPWTGGSRTKRRPAAGPAAATATPTATPTAVGTTTARPATARPAAGMPQALRPVVLAWCWAASIFVFFSLSSSKLPGYILPVIPALALVAAVAIERRGLRGWRWQLPMLGLACALVALSAEPLAHKLLASPEYHGAAPGMPLWIVATALLCMIGVAQAWRLLRRRRGFDTVLTLAMTLSIMTTTLMFAYEDIGRVRAGRDVAAAIERRMTPDMPLYSVRRLDHTLPFYLRRPMTMVETSDELGFGLGIEPWRWLPTLGQFIETWRSGPQAIAVMTPETRDELARLGLPMTEIARHGRRVAVLRFPEPAEPRGGDQRPLP